MATQWVAIFLSQTLSISSISHCKVTDRAAQGIPPLPLNAQQASALCELLQNTPAGEEEFLLALLGDRHF